MTTAWIEWNGTNDDFDRVVQDSEVLWSWDRSEPYEPCEDWLLLMPNGRVAHASMSSCSCWPDRGSSNVTEYPSLRDALGPLGVPAMSRDAGFHALCEHHGVPPTYPDDAP